MAATRVTSFARDGLLFDVRDTGPVDGVPVVCLHGFPQDGTAYDGVAARLGAAGARVLVPDQRGYSPGARPEDPRAYTLRALTDDVLALLDAAAVEKAHVVGHDWGGAVAWALASRHGSRVESLTALSTPHPAALSAAARRSSQLLRSSYIVFFQLPMLPELIATAAGGAGLRVALRGSGLGGGPTRRYVSRMREPGAMTAALNWYRAIALSRGWGPGRVEVPTTYVVGRRDPFFSAAAVAGTRKLVTGPFELVELDAGHWLPEQRAAEVAAAVLARAGLPVRKRR